MGISVIGKELFPAIGEFNAALLANCLAKAGIQVPEEFQIKAQASQEAAAPAQPLPGRPPVLCAGCPHRGVFYALKRQKLVVSGDIGCYSLGSAGPLSAMDTCICMGASVGVALQGRPTRRWAGKPLPSLGTVPSCIQASLSDGCCL